ncbi:MAG: hypothetical protein ACE5E5_03400 [Phycisphaerae bacterium]
MVHNHFLRFGACVLGVVLLTQVGCKDLLVYQNFSYIREHASSQEDVTRLIGDPSARLGNKWMYDRPAKHLQVFIDFDESGRCCRKQWIDSLNNIWEDSDESGGGGSARVSDSRGGRSSGDDQP